MYAAARLSADEALKANGGTMPACPGMRRRIISSGRLSWAEKIAAMVYYTGKYSLAPTPVLMQAARLSALKALKANGGTMPAYPGMQRRIPSSNRLLDQAGSAAGSPIAAGKIHGPLPHLLTYHGH